MADNMFVQTKVRDVVKGEEKDFRLSEEFLTKLGEKLEADVKSAVARAKANGRKTLQPQDL